MVKFYDTYPILSAVRRELQWLSWTHLKSIIYLNDDLKRKFYATLKVVGTVLDILTFLIVDERR